jgi:hypothetical protein
LEPNPVTQFLLKPPKDLGSLEVFTQLPYGRRHECESFHRHFHHAFQFTAKNRLLAAPEISTVDEAWLPEFYVAVWHGLWASKGTPKNIIAKRNAAVVDALADPAMRQRLPDLGQEIFPREPQTPEALGAYQKAEIEKWWPIILGGQHQGRMNPSHCTIVHQGRAGSGHTEPCARLSRMAALPPQAAVTLLS